MKEIHRGSQNAISDSYATALEIDKRRLPRNALIGLSKISVISDSPVARKYTDMPRNKHYSRSIGVVVYIYTYYTNYRT